MRVALVHDYWVHLRGGERVFLALTRMFPEADCYTLIRRRDALAPFPADRRLRTSVLQRVPFAAKHFRAVLPLYPWAAEHLDLRGYDLVISSSSGFCHAARTDGTHICYCHSPLRYAWHEYDATLADQRSPVVRRALASVLSRARASDYVAAQRVGLYVANSRTTQARILDYYGRESRIVHPFIDTTQFSPQFSPQFRSGSIAGGYALVVSQLLPYKRVDLAVVACTKLNLPLVVVGEGPERARLEQMAGPEVTFSSRVGEAELARLYANCAVLLQCGIEDFGMATLEAQASGRPVLAYGAGGALETVLPEVSGAFIVEQSVDAVAQALVSFNPAAYDPMAIRAHAERFDEGHFAAQMFAVVHDATQHSPVAVSAGSPYHARERGF